MSGIIAAGAVVGAGALAKGIYGITQENKAANIEKNNIRPVMPVDPAYQENVNTAQQIAIQGTPQEVINRQTEGIDQNVATGIGAVSRSANPGAGVSSIVRQGNIAKANMNAEDAAARNRNTLLLIQQRGLLARAKQDAWNYNYADKYSEKLAESQAYRGAGAQNISGAFNDLSQGAMGVLGNRMGGLGSAGAGYTSGVQMRGNTTTAPYYNYSDPNQIGESTTS